MRPCAHDLPPDWDNGSQGVLQFQRESDEELKEWRRLDRQVCQEGEERGFRMSSEEQAAAIGRAVVEYAEIRKELAALYSEGDRYFQALDAATGYFRRNPYGDADRQSESPFSLGHQPNEGQASNIGKLPTADDIIALVDRVGELNKRNIAFAAVLREAGVPL